MPTQEYDIFFSYSRKDKDSADKIVRALRDSGLNVWLDENEIKDFDSIMRNLTLGLSRSKALVAYYSSKYPKSRYCQWEFTSAFLTGQREGDPIKRIMVLNPEEGYDHIMPSEFQDALFKRVPNDPDETALNEIAKSIKEHISSIPDQIGQISTFNKPAWYGRNGIFYTNFVGRLKDMWDIHSKLNSYEKILITSGTAQVHGMGGIGKSLLAEEYAMRFGGAYPGGIYWLSASEADPEKPDLELEKQLRVIALEIGISQNVFESDQENNLLLIIGEIARHLESKDHPSLWIVDDIPNNMNTENLRKWFAPHQNAKTLITTRSTEYNVAERIALDVLEEEDAYMLLTSKREPTDQTEEVAARQIIEMLGFHALAIDVASSAVTFQSFTEFLEGLKNPNQDELDLAADLTGQLPNGHEPSIATTLLRSIELLDQEGIDFLIIASILAQAPIPTKLVQKIFEKNYATNKSENREMTLRALHNVHTHSLATQLENDEAWEVHALISRVIEFHYKEKASKNNIGEDKILDALIETIKPNTDDTLSYDQKNYETKHAEKFLKSIDSHERAALAQHLADYYYNRSSFNLAIELYELVIPFVEKELGNEDRALLTIKSDLASTLRAKGFYLEAKELLEEVFRLNMNILGEDHPHTIRNLLNLAGILKDMKEYDQAIDKYEKGIQLSKRINGNKDYITLASMNNFADALRDRYVKTKNDLDLSKAQDLYQKLLELLDENPELLNVKPLRSAINNGFGLAYKVEGDLLNAKKYLEEALISFKEIAGLEHTHTTEIAWNLYTVLKELNDIPAAEKILNNYLLWILDKDPNELSRDQKYIQNRLSK